MKVHKNARTTPQSRALIVRRISAGQTAVEVAAALGISLRTVRKWLARERTEGAAGLLDRSTRPKQSPTRLAQSKLEQAVALRLQRLTNQEIADQLRLPVSTLARHLARLGMGKLPPLHPPPPVVRYERDRPGELIHIDTKKLGRFQRLGHRIVQRGQGRSVGAGWDYLHVCVDDAVMTDNGNAYRSRSFAKVCRWLNLVHKRTRPYTPRTNGKAERFIQTLLRSWAYRQPYPNSGSRNAALPDWLHRYNHLRPHASLGRKPPISRLAHLGGEQSH
jgi:transposase InsO family protein